MENGKADGIGHPIAYRTPDTHDQTPPPSNQQSATRNCSVKRCKNSYHPITAAECASNIVRRRSNAIKRIEHLCSILETMLNYVRHSLRCFRSPSKLSMYRGQENTPDGLPP